MAAHATRERIVKIKIEEIDQVKLQIINSVDQVTRNSQSWIDSQGSVGSYQDLNVQLDSAINWLCEIVDKINTLPEPEAKAATMLPPTLPFAGPSSDELLRRMDALEHKGKAMYSRLCLTDETMGRMDKKMKSLEDRQDFFDSRLSQLEKEKENDRVAIKKGHQPDTDVTQTSAEGNKTGEETEGDEYDDSGSEYVSEPERDFETSRSSSDDDQPGLMSLTEAAPVLSKIGFKARMPRKSKPVSLPEKKRVTCFTNVTGSFWRNFDPYTCTFTVPVAGRYRVYLEHSQCCKGDSDSLLALQVFHLRRQPAQSSGRHPAFLFYTQTEDHGCYHENVTDNACHKDVDLNVGDQLYVECEYATSTVELKPPACFSCTMLKD